MDSPAPRLLAPPRIAAAVTAVLGLLVLALVPAARADRLTANPASAFARIDRACQAPKPDYASCFALVRHPASAAEASRPGVKAYTRRDGAAAGPAGGLTPALLASAYDFEPAAAPATKQTVAIVDAYDDPDIESDLGKFDTYYSLPACTEADGCFEKVGQTGSKTSLPAADTTGWSVEIALDVEMAHSTCRQCKILLVETDSSRLPTSGPASTRPSSSEPPRCPTPTEARRANRASWKGYNHPGVVITAASGDDGFNGWLDEEFPNRPNVPASLPSVVAVGGTTLTLDESGRREAETVWNGDGVEDELSGSEGARGGGCSRISQLEPWQHDASGFAATGCGGKRSATDVSADANPLTGFDIYDCYNCGEECERFKTEGKSG